MQLKKTKLAGIISLLLCSNAMAVTVNAPSIGIPTDGRFGPFVSAMDTSSAASIATYTNTFAQSFTYDIGAPWTYNEYCVYDDDVCDMFWEGSKSDRLDDSDGLYVWRRNILNTYNGYNGTYASESTTSVNTVEVSPFSLTQSRKITALDGNVEVGYGTSPGSIVRRGFYGDEPLAPEFTGEKGGFSSAHDAAQVTIKSTTTPIYTFDKKLIVGQASVSWANASDSSTRFNYCFDYPIDDDRYDYDDLYYCPGFNLQASFWDADNTDNTAKPFTSTWINGLTGNKDNVTYIANAYAINTSGFTVGFSTDNVYSGDSGGRARAVIFKPTVKSTTELSYNMTEISKPKTDAGKDFNDVIRDTVAIDITDAVYSSGGFSLLTTNTDAPKQAFIVVGNRSYETSQNRSYATEFYTYDVKTEETRYPFQANPIKGANSQVSKINNDGLVVGWRDARGETSPTVDGSARFQSAFIYDYKTKKSAYLDDLYCGSLSPNEEVRYRFANAISISDPDSNGDVVVVSNSFDYETTDNYKNRVGSTPVVLTMTITADEISKLSTTSQCPIKAEEKYERSGAGMGWFILLPTMLLLFRRFKR